MRNKPVFVHIKYVLAIITIVLISLCFLNANGANVSSTANTNSSPPTFEIIDYVNPGLKLLSLIAAFAFIVYKLNKQHQDTIKLHKRQFKEKIQHDIFNEIRKIIDETANSYAKLSSKLHGITMKMDSNLFLSGFGITSSPIKERPDIYQDLHYSFSQSILKLIFVLEKYTITDPIFEIFNMAFQSTMHDLDKIFRDIHDSLLKLLPVDVSEEDQERLGVKTIEPKSDKKKVLANLKENIRVYDTKLIEIIAYIKDLEVEIQNILLSEIFDNTLLPRKHNDDEYVVISNNTKRSLEEIEHYFMHKTEWGKRWQKAKSKKQ